MSFDTFHELFSNFLLLVLYMLQFVQFHVFAFDYTLNTFISFGLHMHFFHRKILAPFQTFNLHFY